MKNKKKVGEIFFTKIKDVRKCSFADCMLSANRKIIMSGYETENDIYLCSTHCDVFIGNIKENNHCENYIQTKLK